MRVLVVEDDRRVSSLVRRVLEGEGYSVDVADRGDDGLRMATSTGYDAVILDVMLPSFDGLAICRRLRQLKNRVPVIMLTARGALEERVAGLDAGADDYLAKPFEISELRARIKALIRRTRSDADPLVVGGLMLDPAAREVSRDGDRIVLSAREFDLLEFLIRNRGRVTTRAIILDEVWGMDYVGDSNVVDVYVRYLREKIDRPFGRDSIQTVRGVGYRFSG